MIDTTTFSEYILGSDLSFKMLLASYFMCLIGMVTVIFLDLISSAAKPTNEKNKKWALNWKFFWKDNKTRIITNAIASILVLFALMRFTGFITDYKVPNMWIPYCVGASIDTAIIVFRKKTQFNFFNGVTDAKEKEEQKYINIEKTS